MNSNLVLYFRCLAVLIVFLLPWSAQAQSAASLVRHGDQAMELADYYTAIHYYQQAVDKKAAIDIRLRLANASRLFKAYEQAIEHYKQIESAGGFQQFAYAQFHLALCYQVVGDYENAIDASRAFLASQTISEKYKNGANDLINNCKWAQEQIALEDESNWQLERLGRRINSAYGEFGAYKQGDSLLYTSYKYELKKDSYQPSRKISKVLVSKDEKRGRIMSRGFNEDSIHTAHIAISKNEQYLFFNRCRFTEGAQIKCDLYVRKKDSRHRWKKQYQKLADPINIAGYTTTQPAIMWDSIAQKEYLLFVSDRLGGSASMNIWKVAIPEDLKSWETPTVLELGASEGDISPYFDASSQQLYFASKRYPSFGAYDLYAMPYLGQDLWGQATNLGPSINSSYDDTYPFVDATKQQLYFSSNRPGGRYLDGQSKTCCPDIFKAKQIEEPPVQEDTLTSIPIAVVDPKPATPELELPKTLEEFLPLKLYFDNDHPNPRTRKTTTSLSYTNTYQTYLEQEDHYYQQFNEEEAIQDELASFFEEEVSGGFKRLDRFSSILLALLEDGQDIEIFLKGYTSPRAKGDYNLLLGKRRVSAVRNHFEAWNNQVFKQYITSGQLIISEVSFGETKASTSAKDEKSGERLSIYSPAAAKERRVEIVEVKRN